jgi:hypothetical protein
MTYGPSLDELYWRAAGHVYKILQGVKVADLPIEQPVKFDFVLNMRTAKALGLTIPPSLLALASAMMVGKGGHFRSVLTATDIVDPPTRLLHVYRANFLDKKSSLSQGQIKRRANSSLAATCMMPASSRGRGQFGEPQCH